LSEQEAVDRDQVLVAVVDEDPWTVRSVNGVLRDVGFRTLGFSSPRTALDILVPRRCDVVITEQRMSELTGSQLSELARDQLGENCPGFVLLTRTLANLEPGERGLFEACVEKPFQVISLIAAIEKAVRARPRRIVSGQDAVSAHGGFGKSAQPVSGVRCLASKRNFSRG
jgi:FixJ family two-component response regulator